MRRYLLLFLLILQTTLFALSEDGILSVDQAFKPSVETKDKVIHTHIQLADGIYVYHDKLKYRLLEPKKILLNPNLKLPKPTKHDEFIVHFKGIDVNIPLALIRKKIGKKPFKLQLEYQGCSTKGLCYPPKHPIYAFDASGHLIKKASKQVKKEESLWGVERPVETTTPKPNEQEKQEIPPKVEPVKVTTPKAVTQSVTAPQEKSTKLADLDQNKLLHILKNSSFFVILGLFFLLGLGLAFTPCIFPMIPILSSIITLESKQSGHMSAKRGFFLSLVYIVAAALVYAIAGVLSALFGANILSAMQNPWVIILFSLIFVTLAFSMFGYYEIQLPQKLQNFANQKSESSKGGGIIGVAIMGALSALIVGPCVAPPLAAALIFIGQTGDIVLGGLALFLLGLGMGAPLLLIGLGGGKFMPKPGGWMTKVSYIFGVVMLGIAISFLSRILPEQATMLLWALLFIASGVYAGAMEPFAEGVSGLGKFLKVIAVVLLSYGIILFFGAFLGGKSILDPLANLHARAGESHAIEPLETPSFQIVKTKRELAKAIVASQKPILIDFSAKWCAACKELEEETFADPKVASLMKKFTLLRVDVTKNSKDDKALQKSFGIVGPPAIIFYNPKKEEQKDLQVVGFKPAHTFIPILKKALER